MNADVAQAVRVSIDDSVPVHSLQGQVLRPVIHRGTADVAGASAGMVRMPGNHVAKVHVHRHTEVIVYVLEGFAATLWGEQMEPLLHGPESVIYIPPGVPHTAVNLSSTDEIRAVEFRTDPRFNHDTELLPGLEEVAGSRVVDLRHAMASRP